VKAIGKDAEQIHFDEEQRKKVKKTNLPNFGMATNSSFKDSSF
jgi:hypothetical protein